MGSKRIRYKYKDRKGITSLFNSKGYPRGKRGQPKLNPDITIGIIAKIKSYKRYTPFKAWIQITKLKGFSYILDLWFKNKAVKNYWYKRFQNDPEVETGIRANFWRNHLQKHFNKK